MFARAGGKILLPKIDSTSSLPSSLSYTDMISDFTHDYFAYSACGNSRA
ncbi:hypothetical protein [Leptospira kmetyi]|nr:hypothetical protein [Leptospira kmetyi]